MLLFFNYPKGFPVSVIKYILFYSIHWGYKIKEKELMYPQFQNAWEPSVKRKKNNLIRLGSMPRLNCLLAGGKAQIIGSVTQ